MYRSKQTWGENYGRPTIYFSEDNVIIISFLGWFHKNTEICVLSVVLFWDYTLDFVIDMIEAGVMGMG
jgi:TRAP-type mannitol/chloroaromatic compound transport system permease large subunit